MVSGSSCSDGRESYQTDDEACGKLENAVHGVLQAV